MRSTTYADPDPKDPDPSPGADTGAEAKAPLDWMTGDEKEVAKAMTDLFLEQSKLPMIRQKEAQWKANDLRRDGYTGVRVFKTQRDVASYQVWVPMGGKANLELANEARRLCRVFVGNLMSDPPAPQVFPVDTGEDDRDSSDVSERALNAMQAESKLNTPGKVRDALDTACTFDSGFIHYVVDPTAGGRTARTMLASPLAQTTTDPLVDPATGMPHAPPPQLVPHPTTPGVLVNQPQPAPDPVERTVHQDQQGYTDQPQDAAYDWQKGLRSEVLTGRNVRLLPHTVESIWEAHGVMIATFQPWKRVKGMFPELAKLPEAEIRALLEHRPAGSEHIRTSGDNQNLATAEVFTLVICYTECADYPDGFYGIAVGGKAVPWRKPWVSFASGQREALYLPVSQVKLFRNGKQDPYGDGLMADLGGISEVMAAQIGHALAYLDWFNNPTVYLPLHSTIQEADILARKPIIRYLPGGEPMTLNPPNYPQMSMTVFEAMSKAAQEAAHTPATAQGVEDPNVQSGRHAYQIVAQAHAQLSEPKQNIERAYVRCCEIELQYARAFGLSGDAKWTGDDGDYKVARWQGADLCGDVQVKPGTMTMLSPAAKAQLTEQWMTAQILTPEEGREMLAGGIGAVIGLRDDPFKLEIRRQIAAWEQGPPPGWQPVPPPEQVVGQELQQAGMNPALAGQAIQAGLVQPPPPDPAIEAIWQPRAHHALPGVAQIRVTELAKLMATRKFAKQDRGWQALAEQEFETMKLAAAPPMPAPPPEDGEGGKPPASGGGSFAAGGMPALDNPALT